jgi:hypothetical protein
MQEESRIIKMLPLLTLKDCDSKIVKASTTSQEQLLALQASSTDSNFLYLLPPSKTSSCLISEDLILNPIAQELLSQYLPSSILQQVNTTKVRTVLFQQLYLLYSRHATTKTIFPDLAIILTSARRAEFQTRTRIFLDKANNISVEKELLSGKSTTTIGNLTLVETKSSWQKGLSLHAEAITTLKNKHSLKVALATTRPWLDFLKSNSDTNNKLPGNMIDAIWTNCFIVNNELTLIDQEWQYAKDLPLAVLVIRSLYNFITKEGDNKELQNILPQGSLKNKIMLCAQELGITLNKSDFTDFVNIEVDLQATTLSISRLQLHCTLRLRLFSDKLYRKIRCLKQKWK